MTSTIATPPVEPPSAIPTVTSRARTGGRPGSGRRCDRAMARDAMPAVSKSSTTASGVTMPRGLVAIRSLRYRRPPRQPGRPLPWTSTASSPATRPAGTASSSSPRLPRRSRSPPAARSTSWCSSTSARRRTCRTPGPQQADPALIARLTRLVADGGRRALRQPDPLEGRPGPLLHHHASPPPCGTRGGSCWRPPLLLFVPAVADGRLAGRLGRRPRRGRLRTPCARPTSRTTSRPTTRRRPAGRVRHRGDRQQHPGGDPGLRGRGPAVRGHGVHPRDERGQRGARPPACSRPPGQQPKFYGLILPHGLLELSAIVVAGGGRAGHRVGHHRPGRPAPAAVALADEGRRSAVDRPRPDAGLRRGRHDRGLRHPQRPADGRPRRHRRSRSVVAFWTYVVVLGRRAASLGYTGAFGEHELLERQRARRRGRGGTAPAEPPDPRRGRLRRVPSSHERAAGAPDQLGGSSPQASDDDDYNPPRALRSR